MSIDTDDFTCKVDVEIDYDSESPKNYKLDGGKFEHHVKYIIDIEPKSWGLSSINIQVPVQIIYGSLDIIFLDSQINPDEDSKRVPVKINLNNCTVDCPDFISRNGFSPSKLVLKLSNFKYTDAHDFECDASGVLDFNI